MKERTQCLNCAYLTEICADGYRHCHNPNHHDFENKYPRIENVHHLPWFCPYSNEWIEKDN